MHERGVVTSEPGLYFVGLPFQFAVGLRRVPRRGSRRPVRREAARTAIARSGIRTDGRRLIAGWGAGR